LKPILKLWRLGAGKTTEAAASEVGVTVAMWNRWENGRRRIPAGRVLDIDRMTGVSRYELRSDVFGSPEDEAESLARYVAQSVTTDIIAEAAE